MSDYITDNDPSRKSEDSRLQQAITWRRTLHQIPELELDLPMTVEYVKKQLADLEGEIIELDGCGSSFAYWFDFGKDHAVAFRTDMDALPVKEVCTHDFVSRHPGKMHACGHDGHMTNLLLLAHAISDQKKKGAELPNNILLLFQAGEETPGGAELICKTGLLKDRNVKAVFGLHLWPLLEKGVIGTRANEFMARASEINIDITGRSAHAARYHEGIDAMEAAAELLFDMYQMEQAIDPEIYRLLRFGRLEAGSVRNAVAEHARIEGSIRSFQDETMDYMVEQIQQLADRQKEKRGVTIDIEYSNGYPAVINHIPLTDRIFELCDEVVPLQDPEMIAEDFAFYQKEVPGVFFFLGTGTGIPLHASSFDFDEALLLHGADLFERLALHDWSKENFDGNKSTDGINEN